MPNKRTGREIPCSVCGTLRYWSAADIRWGRGKTCGARECRSKWFSGEGNPFWGKRHSPETREKIKAGRAKNPPKRSGPLKGGFNHTEEAKKRISEASKRTWAEKRELMLASLPRGAKHHFFKDPELRRHRLQFSPLQRREWTDSKCAYCDATEHLELDHVIPIFDGGKNVKENAQTLCRGCNIWKVYAVDLPRRRAYLAIQGG